MQLPSCFEYLKLSCINRWLFDYVTEIMMNPPFLQQGFRWWSGYIVDHIACPNLGSKPVRTDLTVRKFVSSPSCQNDRFYTSIYSIFMHHFILVPQDQWIRLFLNCLHIFSLLNYQYIFQFFVFLLSILIG